MTDGHKNIFFFSNRKKTRIFSHNATDKKVRRLALLWEGYLHGCGSPCPFVVHCSDPETLRIMLSGDGSQALVLGLCKNKGHLQRWGLDI